MQYRILGKTGLSASVIGYGCNKIADRDADPKEVEATIESALDHGINLFDTADAYAGGESERLLGRVLLPHRRKILLCSKAGYRSWLRVTLENTLPLVGMFAAKAGKGKGGGKARPNTRPPRNFAPRILSMAIENSLRRLQTDYLDIFYLHSPPQEIAAAPEVFEALKNIQQKGWIRHYGISFSEAASTAEVLHCLPNDGNLGAAIPDESAGKIKRTKHNCLSWWSGHCRAPAIPARRDLFLRISRSPAVWQHAGAGSAPVRPAARRCPFCVGRDAFAEAPPGKSWRDPGRAAIRFCFAANSVWFSNLLA